MAEVALHLELREPKTVEEIATECGKSFEETKRLLWESALAGITFLNEIDGVDKYWHDIWVPGHMEMIVNNKDNVKKYPEIAKAFEEYGRVRGPQAAGIFPVGTGNMRVIPIEESIEGETRRASFEEISKYLEDNELFTVSDCSCRTSREVMGEGCGHLKEDICIQIGHAAEFYIRTGRGQQINREEAYEIIRKAEENGLVHSIPNLDGYGETHAICNCCGCSCFAYRIASMYRNPDMVRSNYVSEVDEDKCSACGECVENCPTNALRLGQKLCSTIPNFEEERPLPHDTEWGPDKWNPDYRTNRQVIADNGTSPCKSECPAHIGVQGYIKLAAQGEYTKALELIKEENPFPAVCGRVCPKNCESACTRNDLDDPLAIDDIKKFIAEQDLNQNRRFVPKIKNNYGNQIAVIGAGPSGLSCAYYLAIDGYNVTVFEKQNVLGGMLNLGIPSYRLEKDVINAEIEILKELGVEFKTGIEIGNDMTLDDLRNEGYEAFYLAIGAQAGKKLGIEGENAEGVVTGVDFLRQVNLNKDIELNGTTIVLGGGNVAIDVARTATRTNSSQVNIFCLETKDEMPALEEEIEEASSEGIGFNNSWGPKRILTENGKVSGVEFKKCISVFDENGNFNPSFDENETKIVKADNVLISIGQEIDWGNLISSNEINTNSNQTVIANHETFQTTEADVFAGGDVLTGPKFAIDAIAVGKEGAISIHRYVHPGQSLTLGRTRREYRPFDKENIELEGYDRLPRQRTSQVDGNKSKETFRDLRGTFTEEQVEQETERCLDCGTTVVDEFMCVGCGTCVINCKFDAISLKRKYDAANVELKDLKSTVMKYAIKRKLKIKTKKIKSLFTASF